MLSAVGFNLDQSKILLSGNGLKFWEKSADGTLHSQSNNDLAFIMVLIFFYSVLAFKDTIEFKKKNI